MNHNKSTIFLALLCAILMISCSREKKTASARAYHNTTSYFNGYYNANYLFNETIGKLENNYRFPLNDFIEIVNFGKEEEMSTYKSDLDEVIKKNDVVIFKHPNGNWIDACRLLNGKAWFYKQNYSLAMQNFDEVLNTFSSSDREAETYLWIAKTFYQMENLEMARAILEDNLVGNDSVRLNKEVRGDVGIFQARMLMDEKLYQETVDVLEEHLPFIRVNRRRARTHFLLGQLYAHLDDYPKSLEHFQAVLKNTNQYEFRFRAQMKIAHLFVEFQAGQDDDKMVQKYLKKLLKDEKNEENLDQVYYAFATLEIKKDSLHHALDYLKESVRANVKNQRQKALSYYKAGQIYFYDYQDYPKAQAYYDSASQVITVDAPEYKEIKRIAGTLGDYINYLNTISYQDSMLYLADLPKDSVDAIVDRIIEEEKRKAEEAKRLEVENQLNTTSINNLALLQNQGRRRPGGTSSSTSWYFDDPGTVSNGKIQFQQIWGQRRNEDNWRRKNKAQVFNSNDGAGESAEDSTSLAQVDSTLIKTYGDKYTYYKDIPQDSAGIAAAHAMIEEAYYGLGQLYSQKLEEPDSAINTFETLLDRYEDSDYTLRARYALYQLYQAQENPIYQVHENYIVNEHPNTIYAYLILGKDPELLKKDEEDYTYAYEGLFNAYRTEQYFTSLGFSEFLLDQFQDVEEIDFAKVHYIRGMSYGYIGDKDSLRKILNFVVQNYPDKDVGERAKATLAVLDAGGPKKTEEKVLAMSTGSEASFDGDDPKYKGFTKEVKASDKIFILMYINRELLPKSDMQSKISNFNKANFKDAKLKVFVFDYNKTKRLLPYVSRFSQLDRAKAYIKKFTSSDAGKELLSSPDAKIFFITHPNFKEAYGKKRMEDYIAYYENVIQK